MLKEAKRGNKKGEKTGQPSCINIGGSSHGNRVSSRRSVVCKIAGELRWGWELSRLGTGSGGVERKAQAGEYSKVQSSRVE